VPGTRFDLSEDRQPIADLLRTRLEDGYEPPPLRVTSDATLERELELLGSEESLVTVTRQGSQVLGLASWRSLAFDSEQLGIPAARLDLLVSAGGYAEALERKVALLGIVAEECRLRGFRYLTARVAAGELSTIHALSRSGFDMLDGLVTFSIRLDRAERRPAPSTLEVRLFQEGDLDQLLEIARSSYTCDRFHIDRALAPGAADRLYAAWVTRSCTGKEADAVIVTTLGGRVAGYVTCKLVRDPRSGGKPSGGVIGLVATAEDARGQGVASATLQAAFDWFRQQSVNVVEVGTQMQNAGACRLYGQCGFRMVRMSLTYRRLL
jgi:GNAT superfamily N-acetyltransferase